MAVTCHSPKNILTETVLTVLLVFHCNFWCHSGPSCCRPPKNLWLHFKFKNKLRRKRTTSCRRPHPAAFHREWHHQLLFETVNDVDECLCRPIDTLAKLSGKFPTSIHTFWWRNPPWWCKAGIVCHCAHVACSAMNTSWRLVSWFSWAILPLVMNAKQADMWVDLKSVSKLL
jgi:hypothetical protein